MRFIQKALLVLMVWLMLFFCLGVSAASVADMNDENTYVDTDGTIYTYQNDKVYKVVGGRLYEVVNGQEQTIIDAMKKHPSTLTPNASVMENTTSVLGKTVGVALSAIIYIFFALTAFTTVCDLAYIGIPGVRGFMYNTNPGGAEGYSSYTRENAMKAQNQGDMMRAAQLHASADRIEMSGAGIAHVNGQPGQESKGFCLISRELRSLMNDPTVAGTMRQDANFAATTGMNIAGQKKSLIFAYLKRRAVAIVIIIAVFMLLVTTSVFTDFGLNIGQFIYDKVAGFLGF